MNVRRPQSHRDNFATEVNKFAEEIRAIGPNPIRL